MKIMKETKNIFERIGISKEEADSRMEAIFETMFHGNKEDRIYFEAGEDMGYMVDTGNNDARTEGMSYGMMMCVQMNKKEEFDRIWKWAKNYMFMDKGDNAGFFAWSCALNGKKNAYGPAPDGEEYFAMALLLASKRFGNGEGIYDYEAQAKQILHDMVHKGEPGTKGRAMFDPENKLIRFICEVDWSDPSYHLPHFYEYFAKYGNPEDSEFFLEAAKNSREYLHKACHAETGLSAEYADYDGRPHYVNPKQWGTRHDWFYSDAYRTIMNLCLDYAFFEKDPWQIEEAKRYNRFFMETIGEENWSHIFEVDGTMLEEPALHPVAIIATNAMPALIVDNENTKRCLQKFWDTPLRKGERRYYDNCLYFFCFLALSGNYRLFE